MKYAIEGFSQKRSVELGLNVEDLVILRWFVDFWPSPKMTKMEHEGKIYALVSYSGFIDQMPIIGCNKRTIARKFQRLVDAGVLENTTIKQGGSFSVYRFGKNYESLAFENVDGCTRRSNGVVQESTTGLYENVQPNTNLLNTNLLNTNIKERKKEKASFDEIIKSYSDDEEIRGLLTEWIKVRKLNKAPLTDRALELNLNKLDAMAEESGMLVKDYLKEVVCRGWRAFYPIKKYSNQKENIKQEEVLNELPDWLKQL